MQPADSALYSFIKGFIASNGYSPTRDEAMAGTGERSASKYALEIFRLQAGKLIEVTPGKARSIKILGE